MKKTLIAALLVAMPALVWVFWPVAPRESRSAAPAAAASTGPLQPLELSATSQFMDAAFHDGKLPEPLAIPPGDSDEQAVALARAVAAKDAHSTAAFVTALMTAGFAIRVDEGHVLKTTGAQGLAFEAWEVAAIAKRYGRGARAPLEPFSRAFQNVFDVFRDAPVDKYVMNGVRTSAESNNPAVRFWARFIAALGMPDYNLLDAATLPSDVRLDAIQTSLIVMRLAGDLAYLEKQRSTPQAAHVPLIERLPFWPVTLHAMAGDPPCTVDATAGTILDLSALGLTTGFGQMVEHLGNGYAKMKAWGQGASFINVLTTLLKFFATYASVEAKIEMDGTTLTRTKTTTAGERHHLKARLGVNPGEWVSITNCLRPALNVWGIDLSLPGKSDLSGVTAIWSLVEDDDTGLDGLLHNARLDGDASEGNTKDSEPVGGVYLEAKLNAQLTDPNGDTFITVVGAPQSEDLTNQKLTNVERKVRVAIFIQAKPTVVPEKDGGVMIVSTIGDYLGPLVATLTGDRLGAIVGLSTESLYRVAWFASDSFPFTVKDWEACGEGWSGTVQAVMTQHAERSTVLYDLGPQKVVDDRRTVLTAKFTNGEGTESVDRGDTSVTTVNGTQFCATNAVPPSQPYESRDTGTLKGSGKGQARLNVSINPNAGTYSIDVSPGFEYPLTMTTKNTLVKSCPGYDRGYRDQVAPMKMKPPDMTIVQQRFDPKNPDTLRGSTTVSLDGSSAVYMWDLVKCGK